MNRNDFCRETQNQWHVFIQDAILEKCNEKGAAIVHISVDKASNEVSKQLAPPPFPYTTILRLLLMVFDE